MSYNGHGLMWAEVPWAGHYVVNSPIWITAHYTQATKPGWSYLPVGQGSGMLPNGGSYVGLVSPGGCGGKQGAAETDYTMVVQTMAYDNSRCFKDTHPRFAVAPNQTLVFQLDAALLKRLRASKPEGLKLFVRRTRLFPGDPIAPQATVPASSIRNRYFEPEPAMAVPDSGEFALTLLVNEVVTVSTVLGAGSKGGPDGAGNDVGLPPIPNSTEWPATQVCASLTGFRKDAPLTESGIPAIDQQGVWEAMPSRDPAFNSTMQQVIVHEPDEWHSHGANWLPYPQTFVGPSADLVGSGGTISCDVMAPTAEGTWAGLGFGGQVDSNKSQGLAVPNILAVTARGDWSWNGATGTVPATTNGWFNLTVKVAPGSSSCSATVNGAVVGDGGASACSAIGKVGGPFGMLAASYAGAGAPAEHRSLCTRTSTSFLHRVSRVSLPCTTPRAACSVLFRVAMRMEC